MVRLAHFRLGKSELGTSLPRRRLASRLRPTHATIAVFLDLVCAGCGWFCPRNICHRSMTPPGSSKPTKPRRREKTSYNRCHRRTTSLGSSKPSKPRRRGETSYNRPIASSPIYFSTCRRNDFARRYSKFRACIHSLISTHD